jgi:hypothetical protein
METMIMSTNPDRRQEGQLLAELLKLISTNKLSLARKVMSTQSLIQACNRTSHDEDRSDAR